MLKLSSNLFSVLYLVRNRGFFVHIYPDCMDFDRNSQTLFCAAIEASNTAYLTGTIIPALESAQLSAASTLPLDKTLWHRCFGHFNIEAIRELAQHELVTGLKLTSKQRADPICEPCLAGKLNAAPFPSSSNRALRPLGLVHSDVHGPLPVRTHSGYRYWIIFIDDSTRIRAVLLLKAKSEAFSAFKQFKAHAENQLNQRIGVLWDDKGGEYMSSEMEAFCIAEGIERQHSVRNRPQQNGVAERFNRVLAEGITAMLSEAGLPSSFWGEALSSLVHVVNRCPTSSLPHSTPFEAFYGCKPDVSHLRIWGCLAYVHVQKDKRGSLGSHMEKAIFIGYPPGYKGWKFYNPATKKVVISERAVFDERYFPGLKNWSNIPIFRTHPFSDSSSPSPSSNLTPSSSSSTSADNQRFYYPVDHVDAQQPHLGGERIAAQPEPADLLHPQEPPEPVAQPAARSPSLGEYSPPPLQPLPLPRAASAAPPAAGSSSGVPAASGSTSMRSKRAARSEPRSPAIQPRTRQSARSEQQPSESDSPSHSPEPSLAERRPRRNVKPPGEWWKVKPATPLSESPSENEEQSQSPEDDETTTIKEEEIEMSDDELSTLR